jgi:phosphatidylethanolamine-binding protein (PEBP) family uncharacterized protein
MSLRANEIRRIDIIVNDIAVLKKELMKYKNKQKSNTESFKVIDNKYTNEEKTDIYKKLYEDEKAKNSSLIIKLNTFLLDSKDINENKKFKKKCNKKSNNIFPKLKMKTNIKKIAKHR